LDRSGGFGGATELSHDAHDRIPADRVVAVSGRLILVSEFASVLGPLIGTSIMAHSGINGLFYFMAAAALLFGFRLRLIRPRRLFAIQTLDLVNRHVTRPRCDLRAAAPLHLALRNGHEDVSRRERQALDLLA
jgi:hypothetical protein